MCLITNQLQPKIAKTNIHVIKELSEDLRPIYYDTGVYVLGKVRKQKMKETNEWAPHCEIDSGWLSKNYPKWTTGRENLVCIGPGLHSIAKSKVELFFEKYVSRHSLYSAIIPKGSRYYKNPVGLYVSNQLIITKKLQNAKKVF